MNAQARLGWQIAVLAGVTMTGRLVEAAASFVIDVIDDPGIGFNDMTPATPVGGNTGTTVGEQRKIAFQAAADAWGRILESAVPVVIEASFAPLECTNGGAAEGQAAPYAVSDYPGLPTTGAYPVALANRILGRDLFPDHPDISAQFNGGLMDCMGIDWYYGLDGRKSPSQSDLLSTVMHELAHGLGFADDVDPDTGAFSMSAPSVFADHVLDTTMGKHWVDMTDAERKASLSNVRKVVWDGLRVQTVAASVLAEGLPSVQVSPSLGNFSNVIDEANFGRYVADGPAISGQVASATISAACIAPTASFSGKIALIISSSGCSSLSAAYYAERSGALAMLFAYNIAATPAPIALEVGVEQIAQFPVTIPTLALTLDDANLIKNASGSPTVTLSADQSRSVGADSSGYTMLYASNPIQPGSTGAHWDPLVRPNLVEEPVEQPIPVTSLEMERALLWDIGWTAKCGNGTVDGQEECDQGAANSDRTPDSCRMDCKKPKCGDGVVDTGEQCDPGTNVVGVAPDPNCRADCTPISPQGAGGNGGGGGRGGADGSGGGSGSGGSASGGASGSGGSGSGGASGSGGTSTGGASGNGGSATGGTNGTGGSSNSGGGKGSGCSCNTARESSSSGVVVLAVGLALMFGRRSRRPAARRPGTSRTSSATCKAAFPPPTSRYKGLSVLGSLSRPQGQPLQEE
jgi:hypothetical protein